MSLCCQQDDRRDAVRRMKGRNGLDYLEVTDELQRTLHVYFLGKLPGELHKKSPGPDKYLRIEGGRRVTDIQITDVEPMADPDPEKDDFLVVKLDKPGDFSTYTLRLIGVHNIDPRYDHVDFSFKVDCPSDLDCAPACVCEPPVFPEPEINYLAKDYGTFRQLILDRLALLVPDWRERHVPDLGIVLVELLAYAGDYLSYYQDAVATEAYLATARQRISVRRHARLVDYFLHEGCNARAWVCVEVSAEVKLDPARTAFITGLNNALAATQTVLEWDDLRDIPAASYAVLEPLLSDRSAPILHRAAHSEIHFYTWGEKECCLERGSTRATLIDSWLATEQTAAAEHNDKEPPARRSLQLKPGDVLIFEEILGAKTGSPSDADPARRHAVRLTSVTLGEDAVFHTGHGRPAPIVEIEWAAEDALPFTFCISALGLAPDCEYIENISVARGNVILVDHGKTQKPEVLGEVPTLRTEATCECANEPSDVQIVPGRFHPWLARRPLTFRDPLPAGNDPAPHWTSAASLLKQDVRLAMPELWLASQPEQSWRARRDLIASESGDRDFVVEIDNDGIAHLRFGDGELGYRPAAGVSFAATYRVGNGTQGNVGAESISRLVLSNEHISGVAITVRNPLPAQGGTDAEPISEAKLFAPHLFRKRIERAIIASDYEEIAERNAGVQNASAALTWTGSWYEADVAIDPFGREGAEARMLAEIEIYLERFRRMSHDLAVTQARYVPLDLKLDVCVLPHYQRSHV